MKFTKRCDHCGHVEVAYTYMLNRSLVNALRKLVDWWETTHTLAELKNLNLTNSQYGNFAHMQYFGLIKPVPGGWFPSEHGVAFIYGEEPTVMPMAVMQGTILPSNHGAWSTHHIQPHEVYVWQIEKEAYKQRSQYAEEKSQNASLFDLRK
ncbi:MAG: hypothetical protein PHI63_06685 [Patescibacteria group bacterium]|nr:hypothetical protein [Patescibacteria group bacterium]